jgi:hypothetical protein
MMADRTGIRFAAAEAAGYSPPMSTITAVLDADPDGTLHLPLPAELRSSKVKVTATLENVGDQPLQTGSKLKALLSAGRGLDGATATARIAEVYEDREAWRPQ